MAFDTAKFSLIGHGRGNKYYLHDAGSDSMATVATAGYFNNTDDNLNLAADDVILSICSDGDMWHRVSAVSSGSVTTQPMSGEGPWRGVVGSASAALSVGVNEIGTGTATAFTLPTPYVGARMRVFQAGSATGGISVATDATTVTLNGQGDRTITFDAEGDNVSLLGVSTTRWAILGGSGVAFS